MINKKHMNDKEKKGVVGGGISIAMLAILVLLMQAVSWATKEGNTVSTAWIVGGVAAILMGFILGAILLGTGNDGETKLLRIIIAGGLLFISTILLISPETHERYSVLVTKALLVKDFGEPNTIYGPAKSSVWEYKNIRHVENKELDKEYKTMTFEFVGDLAHRYTYTTADDPQGKTEKLAITHTPGLRTTLGRSLTVLSIFLTTFLIVIVTSTREFKEGWESRRAGNA